MEKEQQLISRILKGELEAFNVLVSIYQNRIYNFIFKSIYRKEDSEEITQEVFIRVYNNLNKFDMSKNFSTWIFTISINVLRTELKKMKKRSTTDSYAEFPELMSTSHYGQPETAMLLKEKKLLLKQIIAHLSEDQRTALLLKHIQGFSFKEIGDILGISPEAAKMKVQRAKQSIVKDFEKFYERSVS